MLFRKPVIPYYDLHLHILPGMDDGARDEAMALDMLDEEIRQGCRGFVCTPHYYDQETIPQFLKRREEAFGRLERALQSRHPEWRGRIALGAEVAYHNGLVYDEHLTDLCMGKSNFLLLEMPFSDWNSTVLRDLHALSSQKGIRVILAHLERYREIASAEAMDRVLQMDVQIQMNAGALLKRSSRRYALQMVKSGLTQIMGTDSHNMDTRRPNMQDGCQALGRHRLTREMEQILENNAYVFGRAIGR